MGRMFDISDILSITDGRLFSTRHIDGVYDILNYMTGENLYTHQLPRAGEQCKGPLSEQHPELAAVDVPEPEEGWTRESVDAMLDGLAEKYGRERMVEPLPMELLGVRPNPIEELSDMIGPDKVIVI